MSVLSDFGQFFLFCLFSTVSSAVQLVLSPVLFLVERSRSGSQKSFKSVFITGGSSGLGASLATAYAKPGVHIAITGRNVERLKKVEKDCIAKGATVSIATVDVADAEALGSFIHEVDEEHPIDLMIANAGVTGFVESSDDDYTAQQSLIDVINTNVIGVGNTIFPIIPKMIARKNGQVAIMSSLSGLFPFQTAPDYGSSKTNILYLARSMRRYLAVHNVGLSVICPGFVRTALLKTQKKLMFEISTDDALPIMLDGLERNVSVIAFPTIAYLIASMLGTMHPISLEILGPLFFTKLTKKVAGRLQGIESKKNN